jgi:hypothetical protein
MHAAPTALVDKHVLHAMAAAAYRAVLQILNSIAISQWAVAYNETDETTSCFYCANNFNDFPSSIVVLFEL